MPPPVPPSIRPQAVVVVRFSYPAISGFQLSHAGLEQARRTLYDSTRLERRFRLFETLALPSLRAQTDPDFTVVLLVGDDFPPQARARLAAMVAPLQEAHIVALPPHNNFKATKLAIEAHRNPAASHLLTIRLDDDDALGRDCIAAQKALAPALAALGPADAPAVVCFNNGLFLELGAGGNTLFGVIEKLPISVGTCMIAPAGAMPTVFSTDHRSLHTRWNCYTEALTPRFIRTVHRDNDSSAHVSGTRLNYAPDALDEVLARHFPFTRAQLLSLNP
jgi:hypothetical protein